MVKYEAHMDRMPLADLALDTFPVNGHTTTSDQLWAGLPVLTVKGTHFASRVSESLLNAIGLPELVMPDLKAYEEMAIALYEDRNRLAGYRQKLIDNRFTMPLFDAERFRQHLETSYEMMVERAKQGLEPDHFDVPAMPPRTGPFHG
jgi:predicted O-linked N-acetylglucosamine transferase (SPINDLY family)